MFGQLRDGLTGLAAGVLLALMVHCNGWLARATDPVFASWVAHGSGAVVALGLVLATGRTVRDRAAGSTETVRLPRWFYLGGIPGAFVVILSAMAVNGPLALSGAIALMMFGQVLFGLLSDHFGLLRVPKRRVGGRDLLVVLCVLGGACMIIFGGEA